MTYQQSEARQTAKKEIKADASLENELLKDRMIEIFTRTKHPNQDLNKKLYSIQAMMKLSAEFKNYIQEEFYHEANEFSQINEYSAKIYN